MPTKRQHKQKAGKATASRAGGEGKGTVISGHQIYSTVQNGAAGTKLFNSVNYQLLSPDGMGTQIAALANQYNQYRFTRLDIEYKPLNYGMICANDDFNSGVPNANSSNLFAFAYEEDASATFTVTHNSLSQIHDMIIVPLQGYTNRGSNIIHVRNLGSKWYYTKDDTTNSASSRQTIQGTIYGEALTSITSSNQWGELVVHYTVKFKDACPTQGVTLSHLLREVSLGKSYNLHILLKAVQHAVQFQNAKPPQSVLDSYSNEEYAAILGSPRVLRTPLEKDTMNETIELVSQLKLLTNELINSKWCTVA